MPSQINRKTDPQAWLAARHHDITSTEISALFGLSPYCTEFELFHRKRAEAPVVIEDNDRMKWGRRLEQSIAAGVAEDNGWTIRARNVYERDAEARIGSSFDYTIVSHPDGPGLLEVKNVDGLVFKQNWTVNEDGSIEAPEHIELQVQHQLEVADYEWAVIVALVGGNDVKVLHRKRDRDIGVAIRAKVAEFWARVERNDPPAPDYAADADFIIKSLRRTSYADQALGADELIDDLIGRYIHVSKEASDLETLRDSLKAEILMHAGEASKIISTRYGTITCGTTKDSIGTLVTPEMVGTYIGARKGYRQFRINTAK